MHVSALSCTTHGAFRVSCVSLYVHAVANIPAQRLVAYFAHFTRRISLPRMCERVGLCIDLFETCSAFTHVTACTLAKSLYMTLYTRGFSHFVTSMTAPIATGWSDLPGGIFLPLRNAAFSRRTHKTVS